MKVGLYVADVAETVGGGFVVRDGIARAAMRQQGKHAFEYVGLRPAMARFGLKRIKRAILRLAFLGRGTHAWRTRLLREEIGHKKFDVLWFNYASPLNVDTPYIVSILDVEFRLYPWFPELSANGEWDIREREMAPAVQQASIVVVGSEVVRDQIHKFYGVPMARIAVLPFPTPQAALDAMLIDGQQAERDELRIRKAYQLDGDFLFYPAQFWAHKNHVNLLHALRLLRDRDALHFTLVLPGSDQGNFEHVRRTAAELGLADVVRMPGFVPREDIVAFYRSAFALAFVSFHGPENLPILEAQALGCPAVLSDLKGIRELYGEGPVLVDPGVPASIADGVVRLKRDPGLRQRSIEQGRKTALSYTYEAYVAGIEQLLDGFEPIRRCWP